MLYTDITLDSGSAGVDLIVDYQSNEWDYNKSWILADFEDVFFTLCMSRLSAELAKEDLAALWAGMWGEDRTALAIYVNELEYDHTHILMRESTGYNPERYPAE